jgi:uracil-DNA glycosylase
MNVKIEDSWKSLMSEEFNAEYFASLKEFLVKEKKQYKIYPEGSKIFEAFNRTAVSKVKVIIIGQDPYHGDGQAHGLCFSVQKGIKLPPSLRNIYKELNSDIGIKTPAHGDLSKWADNGVLLINSILTVRANQASSHKNKGWENFTNAVIKNISNQQNNCVFILWGNFAQQKKKLIDEKKHLIIESVHPSPLSAYGGFFGSQPFSKTNNWLISKGIKPIDWSID